MQLVSCDKWEWISSDVELCSFSSFTYTHENNKRVTYVPSSHQNNSTHRTPSEPGGLNDDCHNDLKSEDPHKGNNKAEAINETCNFVNRFHIFHLPLFLTKDLWTRHQYSNNDIKITLNHFKSSYHLWCLALQQNLSIANSAVKPSFDSETSTVFGGAAIVRRNLLRHFFDVKPNSFTDPQREKELTSVVTPDLRITKLNFPKDVHRPCLPVHSFSEPTSCATIELFNTLVQMTPKPDVPKKEYSCFFMWRGIRLIPTQWFPQNDTVLMERVVPEPIYSHIYGTPTCFTMQPPYVWIQNKQYAITDEACYFSLRTF